MLKSYCTQNNGDCKTCSLVNYGLDCQNNPAGQGGRGRGQGRKPSGRKRRQLYLTDSEEMLVRDFIDKLRKPSK